MLRLRVDFEVPYIHAKNIPSIVTKPGSLANQVCEGPLQDRERLSEYCCRKPVLANEVRFLSFCLWNPDIDL